MKIALVTGAARGIGRAVASQLAVEGWFVVVNYYSSEREAKSLAAELSGLAIRADVSDPEQVEAMFGAVEREAGELSLLVNNAGVAHFGLVGDTSYDDWRRVFAVNADGVFNCTKLALPAMIRAGQGVIINISSMWGQVGASCESAYSAAKAAVIGFTKAVAKEVAPSGVRVNCVAPGCVETSMLGFSEAELQALREQTPLGRIGMPEDVANLVCFLASEKSAFITGQCIAPNGGFVI